MSAISSTTEGEVFLVVIIAITIAVVLLFFIYLLCFHSFFTR